LDKVTVRAARVNANYTQAEIADKMGVSRATINAWECGRIKMKPHQIFAFCYICGVTEDALILPTESTNVDETEE
jgi:transcriptional regulator with XRE-family HTH domain